MAIVRKIALSAVALAASVTSLAQQRAAPESGSMLEEIVVTAQRREEKIQDVPIAITALSAAQLEQQNITTTLGLGKLIPNTLAFNNTGLATANGYYIRGLGNTESIATFDPPIGTYVDDVFIARQNANNLGLFDMQNIQVLRGPQGTLFGRNTTGGAMNLIMKKPSPEFGGYVDLGVGQFNLRTMRASVDLPVGDRFLTKFSGYIVKDDGYVSDPVTGEHHLNAKDTNGVRVSARWLASDSVTWDVALQRVKDDGLNIMNFESGAGGQAYRGGVVANGLVPIPATGPQVTLLPQRAGLPPTSTTAQSILARCAGVITASRFACTGLRSSGTPLANLLTGAKRFFNLGNDVHNTLITSNIQWKSSIGEIDFITGYVDLKQQFAIDFFNGTALTAAGPSSSNPAGGFTIANDGQHRQFSQEVKLTGDLNDKTRYVAGVYYFDEKNDTDFGDLFSISPTTTLVLEDRTLHNKATAWAVYSQWDFKPIDQWTFTVGGRYTDETKKVDFVANANPLLPAPTVATRVSSANMAALGIPLSQETKQFTPRFVAKYDLNNEVNFFASATRGFKSGGWNARGSTAVANQPFNPEKVWSYELGMRSEWLDRKLRLNLTAFYLDVQDMQTPAAFVAPSGAISFITRNFAGMRNDGLEAELIYSPVDDLTVFAIGGYQNAKYKNIAASIVAQAAVCRAGIASGTIPANTCNSGIVDPSGNISDPVRTPNTLTLGGNYKFHFGSNLTLSPNVLWAHTGNNNVGTSGSPAGLVSAYNTIDGGLTLANDNAGWQIEANCHNCTDKAQLVSVLSDLTYIQDPRTWNLTVKFRFGGRK